MTDLGKIADTNLGGAKRLEVCPIHLVDTVNLDSPAEVTFLEGGRWFSIYTTAESMSWNIGSGENAGNQFVSPEVSAKLPNYTGAMARALERMKQYRYYLVKVTDSNNLSSLVGTPENPMEFDYGFVAGSGTRSWRGFNLSFKGKQQATPPRIL